MQSYQQYYWPSYSTTPFIYAYKPNTHVLTHPYTSINTHIYKYIHIYIYIYIYTCVCVCVCVCMCVCRRTYAQNTYVCVWTCVYIYPLYVCLCIWMCVSNSTCIYLINETKRWNIIQAAKMMMYICIVQKNKTTNELPMYVSTVYETAGGIEVSMCEFLCDSMCAWLYIIFNLQVRW